MIVVGTCVFHDDEGRPALPGERYCGECRDIEKRFLTDYYGVLPSGRAAKLSGEVLAVSWEEAERVAAEIGHTVVGELVLEVEAPEMKAFCRAEVQRRDEEWRS